MIRRCRGRIPMHNHHHQSLRRMSPCTLMMVATRLRTRAVEKGWMSTMSTHLQSLWPTSRAKVLLEGFNPGWQKGPRLHVLAQPRQRTVAPCQQPSCQRPQRPHVEHRLLALVRPKKQRRCCLTSRPSQTTLSHQSPNTLPTLTPLRKIRQTLSFVPAPHHYRPRSPRPLPVFLLRLLPVQTLPRSQQPSPSASAML